MTKDPESTLQAVTPSFGGESLSPGAFLRRSALVYSDRVAIVDGLDSFTYAELADRCARLSGALVDELGIRPRERVSVLVPNTHVGLEAHFGVPWSGAVLNMLNTRLSVDELRYIVEHCGSRVLVADEELADLAREVVTKVGADVRLVVTGAGGDYEDLIGRATPRAPAPVQDWDVATINYTSGTTGRPKGVMYAHRGAYVQALAMATQARIDMDSVFLWTLPMFHCNGWCFPWAATAVGARHVGLRRVTPEAIWRAIREDGVTNFNAAPTVLTDLAYSPWADEGPAPIRLRVATGGAPPSPALLERLDELNIEITQMYGLTETYGPAVVSVWRSSWDALPEPERARLKARQGVANVVGEPLRVVNEQGDVPWDAETPGEVLFRGPNVMLGYYRDPEATAKANADGWFRSGDIGVIHPDGYLELRDRAKDVIISGGENIASIEVEQALASHPAVLESAVVAAPDDRWGEVPVAFVVARPGAEIDESTLIEHVKIGIARYKAPKRVIIVPELPRTATGKIQKYVLRERLWEGHQKRIH